MNNTPKWLRWLTITRSYKPTVESLELIKNALSGSTPAPDEAAFVIVPQSSDCLKALAKVSLGTMYITTMFHGRREAEGIKAFVQTGKSEAGEDLIYIYTKLRVEYLLFLLVFSIIILGLFSSDEVKEGLPTLSGIMVVVLFWFRFIYRFQEKRLVYRLEEYFRLVDHKP